MEQQLTSPAHGQIKFIDERNPMKTHSKALPALLGVAVALAGFAAFGQTTGATPSPTTGTTEAQKAADFAKKEKAMQDMSRSSGGAMMPTPSQATGLNKSKNAGKESADSELQLFTHKGSAPVDKATKAQSPIKNISKMTPEERAQLRKEVVQDAKP
jgi:hypothetical protein